jgi:hypothetical protein
VNRYEGGGPALCKNVAKLQMYSKARRGHKLGLLVDGARKDRNKTAKATMEGVPGSGQLAA